MTKELAAALVGAGATLSAAATPLIWNAIANFRSKPLSGRRTALSGRWEGQGADYYVEDSRKPKMNFSAVMTFTAVGRTVKANATLTSASPGEDEVNLVGMFYNDDYLQLSYYGKTLARKQLGVVVLRLASTGQELTGYYTGFSPRRETIVAGTISLKKKT